MSVADEYSFIIVELNCSHFCVFARTIPLSRGEIRILPSEMQGQKDLQSKKADDIHLFVLVHGLWGEPNHMLTIEKAIKDVIGESSNERIETLKISSFRFWKTLDGLKINADRVIEDIFDRIKQCKTIHGCKVLKISIVGYSLGGLISRYAIGELYEIGFFEKVEPFAFTTFATPHLGVRYFNNNFFYNTMNKICPFIIGKTGLELFVIDKEKILVKMADSSSKYYKGLSKFLTVILLANIKNDRTVPFYSSFITEYSPFNSMASIKVKFFPNLFHTFIGDIKAKPRFVDLSKTEFKTPLDESEIDEHKHENTDMWGKVLGYPVFVIVLFLVLPMWIPFVTAACVTAAIFSWVKLPYIGEKDHNNQWRKICIDTPKKGKDDKKDLSNLHDIRESDKRRIGSSLLSGSIFGQNSFEGIMYAEEKLTGKPSRLEFLQENDKLNSELKQTWEDGSKKEKGDKQAFNTSKEPLITTRMLSGEEFIESSLIPLTEMSEKDFPLFKEQSKLPLEEAGKFMATSLKTLHWIRIPIFLNVWNAHDGIVCRRGPRSNPEGTSSIYLWAIILKHKLVGAFQG